MKFKAKIFFALLFLGLTGCNGDATTEPATTTTMEAETVPTTTPLQDLPPPQPLPCYFMSDLSDKETKIALFEKCTMTKSPLLDDIKGTISVSVDDRLCGTRMPMDNTTADDIFTHDLCYSDPTSTVYASSYIHKVRFINETWRALYADKETSVFREGKLEFELEWGREFLNVSTDLAAAGFESITILSVSRISKTKLNVEALVQFSSSISLADYEAAWLDLTNNETLGTLNLEGYIIEDPGVCPKFKSIMNRVDPEMWATSNADENVTLAIGETYSFTCPVGKKISLDDDGYNDHDDLYTIACASSRQLLTPEVWPTCGKWCWRRLPVPPDHTGLEAVIPPNTIPSGQPGHYMCTDASLGVDSGASEFFEVKCIRDERYEIPAGEFDWPICLARTTTISPLIYIAFNRTLERHAQVLDEKNRPIDPFELMRLKKAQLEKIKHPPNMIISTTLPATVGLACGVLLIMVCTKANSRICLICAEETNEKEVSMKPIEVSMKPIDFEVVVTETIVVN